MIEQNHSTCEVCGENFEEDEVIFAPTDELEALFPESTACEGCWEQTGKDVF